MGDNTAQTSSISFFSESFIMKRGKKPLRTMEFVLDLADEGRRITVEKDIKRLGGKISLTLDEDAKKPFCVVTDHPRARFLEKATRTGSSVSPELQRSLPLLLRVAIQLGIRVRSYNNFLLILINVKNRIKLAEKARLTPVKPKTPRKNSARDLLPPLMKLEDVTQMYAPFWKEFGVSSNFRPMYFGEDTGKSVFHRAHSSKTHKKEERIAKPRARSYKGPGQCDICGCDCADMQIHFVAKEHLTRINTPGLYDEVDELCGSFVKEIVVPYKKLRKRPTPLPLPLLESEFDADSKKP